MHIPFPVEVIRESAGDGELAKAASDYLKEVQPSLERQTLYFSIAYPIMWISFLSVSCYFTVRISWWLGYGFLVFLMLGSHLLFRFACVGAMSRVNIAERLAAYAACFYYRTLLVCSFTLTAILSLVSVAGLYHSLAPLMRQPNQPAAVQPAKGQTGATNATASAAIQADPTNTFENLATAETSQK